MEKEPLEDRAIFTLVLLTGYRRGERWAWNGLNVDFEAGGYHCAAHLPIHQRPLIYTDTTKAASSARSTKISPALVELHRS